MGARAGGRLGKVAAEHLEVCSSCTAFARRFDAAVEVMRDHRADVLPGAGFAHRVTTALPPSRNADLGWAAARLAPAAVALALTLGVWCWVGTVRPSDVVDASQDDDLLTWVLLDEEETAR